ncbi:WD_REPEATS_REGION domain-containing protein [Mortierella sp. 14UC]|nr:WD_REPEATS_REGION domain-containing protein [Mortierella sp. 14UC]
MDPIIDNEIPSLCNNMEAVQPVVLSPLATTQTTYLPSTLQQPNFFNAPFSPVNFNLVRSSSMAYLPSETKRMLWYSENITFPLMEKALEFLVGPGQVLLLLGDSGGGKSTFNRQLEHTLWKSYQRGDPIPLYINLPAIPDPQHDLIVKQLQRLGFSDNYIQDIRQHRQLIVICDGYDESHLRSNLYTTNQLNQPAYWKAKVVISCRTQYLGRDYAHQFQPISERYEQPVPGAFMEAVIASFSRPQIEQYVDQALPTLVDSEEDLSKIHLNRVNLYDIFSKQWLFNNKLRLMDSALSLEAQSVFDDLCDDGFIQEGIDFQKRLAAAIFQYQDGNSVVAYSHRQDSLGWKAHFFASDVKTTLLRESSPLTRSGSEYRFLHRSFLAYLYSRVISDYLGDDSEPQDASSRSVFVDHPLNQRSVVGEPSILQFLAESIESDPSFKASLYKAVDASKTDNLVSLAAANAISVLVKTGVRFNSANLRGIRIPGADLRGGEFDSADLEGADLSKCQSGITEILRVWRLEENDGECSLQLIWKRESKSLFLQGARIDSIVGLDQVNLELLTQRAATKSQYDTDYSSDESTVEGMEDFTDELAEKRLERLD